MEPTTLFIATVVQLISKYGLPMAINLIKTWQSDDIPTVDDIMKLRSRVPSPDSYFESSEDKLLSANAEKSAVQLLSIADLLNNPTIGKVTVSVDLKKDE